jgi:undecaprenyl-diphosphatase
MALLVVIFVSLALSLRMSSGTAFDLVVTHAVQRIDAPAFTWAMVAISAPGYPPWSWLALACATLACLAAGLWPEAIFVLATAGAPFLAASAKLLVERPRPSAPAVNVASQLLDYSYPSGHVVGYVALYGFLMVVVFVRMKRGWTRTLGLIALGSLVGLVGVSRIHLGYHWASDVAGGYALGTAYLLGLIEVYRFVVLRPRGSHQRPSGAERDGTS